MTETHAHTARCIVRAETAVTEELETQGLWDDTYVDGDDLRIPAWNTTIREVAATWLIEGNASCTCDY